MSHAIVFVQFDPIRSAAWLPYFAQVAAENIPCMPFWALRFSFEDESYGPHEPGLLCTLSTLPSSIPIPDASFTLGPKYATDTGEVSSDIIPGCEQLTIHPALACVSETLHQPVYLHTAPILNISGGFRLPVEPETSRHELDPDSLRRFKAAASANRDHAYNAWQARTKAAATEWLAHNTPAINRDCSAKQLVHSGVDPTYIFGQLNNPRTYCFNFIPKGTGLYPEYPTPLYDQLVLYAHLCKEYRWKGVEPTIDWVQEIREYVSDQYGDRPMPPPGCVTADVPVHAPVSTLLRQDPAFRAQVAALSEEIAVGFIYASDSDDERRVKRRNHHNNSSSNSGSHGSSATHSHTSGNNSGIWIWWLEFANPTVALYYPRVELLHTPPVVVLDMFGILLDREGAIRTALEPWLPLARRRPDDVVEAVKLYIELEALATRELRSTATSLPTIVHAALTVLSNKLDMPLAARPALFADAAACILHPRLMSDVEEYVEQLSRYGCAIVGLVPFSLSTLATLRPAFPPRLCEIMQFFPVAIPVHTPVPRTFFAQLRQWCQQSVPTMRDGCAPEDVLIATTGCGRIVEPATVDEHPTVLVWREGSIEYPIQYVVGMGQKSPIPSTSVLGLAGLCRVVDPSTFNAPSG